MVNKRDNRMTAKNTANNRVRILRFFTTELRISEYTSPKKY